MSYHIYTTDGVVLKKTPTGESDLYLHILTKDLGLIIANAKSVRVMQSKLRPALVEYNLINISCIKAKNGWRLTNAVFIKNYYYSTTKKFQKVLSQTCSVLLKMIVGESPNKNIFNIVITAFDHIKNIKEEDTESFESVVMIRILFELGYVSKNEYNKELIDDLYKWDESLIEKSKINRKYVVSDINKAFKESHL